MSMSHIINTRWLRQELGSDLTGYEIMGRLPYFGKSAFWLQPRWRAVMATERIFKQFFVP
jgi:hypothetical protein